MFHKLNKEKILSTVLLIYLLCFLCRILEYFLLRTDQTILGEAFVHKLAGIVILCAAAKTYGFTAQETGFLKTRALSNLLKGLLLGLSVYVLAYLVEMILLARQGKSTALGLYVSAYAVVGNIGKQTALIFFIICIVGNIINVIMEEGLFRGLFPNILEQKYSFIKAALISSFLFGMWHIMAPIRNYYDGTMSLGGLTANMVMLVLTSSLVGFELAMLTGSLYMAMGNHFVNNTIVNILHVISDTGADELMFVRISIAQSTSFVFVLLWYIISARANSYSV